MTQLTTNYEEILNSNFKDIDKLQATPNRIKDHAIGVLRNILENENISNTTRRKLGHGIQSLETISDQSIADNYKAIYQQMCVLAVSNLEAVLREYFSRAADDYKNLNLDNEVLSKTKVSIKEIVNEDLRFGGKLGDLILEKDNSLNFQDLKSIKRAFSNYFNKGVDLLQETEKNLCFYLEVRHALVHNGGKINQKFLKATSELDANIKSYSEGDQVELEQQDWDTIKKSFAELVQEVTKRRDNKDGKRAND